MNLEDAELKYREAIHQKIRAEERVDLALKNLRSVEGAYSLASSNLERLQDDFGESRFELELAIVQIEKNLLMANQDTKASIIHHKKCEEAASQLMLVLRQAEIDDENFQKSVQRTYLKSVEGQQIDDFKRPSRDDDYQDQEIPPLECPLPESSTIKIFKNGAQAPRGREVFRAQLADLGVTVSSEVPEHLVKHIYFAATRAAGKHSLSLSVLPVAPGNDGESSISPLIIAGPPRAGTPPASVRLICLGQGATCLGPELSQCEDRTPRDARSILLALGGTAPVQVCCQRKHALIVAQSGEVFSWGDPSGGKLGLGQIGLSGDGGESENTFVASPVVVEALRGVIVVQAATSAYHSLALTSDGQVFAWGGAANGALGLGTAAAAALATDPCTGEPLCDVPMRLSAFDGLLTRVRVKQVAVGDRMSLAVAESGLVYTWGAATDGRLGVGDTSQLPRDESRARHAPSPILVDGLKGQRVTLAAAGGNHCLACSDRGLLWAWGSAEFGKLGVGDVSRLPLTEHGLPHSPAPTLVTGWGLAEAHPDPLDQRLAVRVVGVSCGPEHSLLVAAGGELFACGSGLNGKLGVGSLVGPAVEEAVMLPATRGWPPFRASPTLVDGLRGKAVVEAACGEEHSVAVTEDGEVFLWGLPHPGSAPVPAPAPAAAPALSTSPPQGPGQLGVRAPAAPTAGAAAPGPAQSPGRAGRWSGRGRGAESPVAVEGLPWGCAKVATSADLTLLLYSGLDPLDYDPVLHPAAAGPAALGLCPGPAGGGGADGRGVGGAGAAVLEHLGRMAESGAMADCVLVAEGGVEVPAHRVMLAAIPALRAAAEDTGRPDGGRVELPTCGGAALRAALRFAYTGEVCTGETVADAMAVLHCAGALGLEGLVRAAARRLETELAPATVAAVWRAAHAQGLRRLEARCLAYILQRYDECKPEAQPTVRDLMRAEPAFFDALLATLSPAQAAPRAARRIAPAQ